VSNSKIITWIVVGAILLILVLTVDPQGAREAYNESINEAEQGKDSESVKEAKQGKEPIKMQVEVKSVEVQEKK
jgi:hypothetical protein